MSLYLEHTPIEEYSVGRKPVCVKREDLFGQSPAPPLGKLRGMRAVVANHYGSGGRLLGCWDTRVSRLGEGLAAAALEFPGLRTMVGFPTKVGELVPPSIQAAERLGAEIFALRGNVTPICYAQAKRRIQGMGGEILPFGLECEAAVAAVAVEAARTPRALLIRGTVVLCAGSGVTLSGLIRGFPILPRRIIALSSGRAIRSIRACLARYAAPLPSIVTIHEATMPYYSAPSIEAPFPTHPNYDLKAWGYLVKNIGRLRPPVLFWNIGA